MPAVDLERLGHQIQAVLAAGTEPEALARASLDLLEFYRDRVRRSPTAQRVAGRSDGRGTSSPVVRALGEALKEAVRSNPDAGLVLAAALWHRDLREARSLAALLVSDVACDEAALWAEPRAASCEDIDVLEELAHVGLARWRREQPQAFLQRAGRWSRAEAVGLRALGFLALQAAAEEFASDMLTALIYLLPPAFAESRGVARRALLWLLQALARRSPKETARLMLDRLQCEGAGMAPLLRDLLPAFPPPQQTVLRESLARQRPPGIIPMTCD